MGVLAVTAALSAASESGNQLQSDPPPSIISQLKQDKVRNEDQLQREEDVTNIYVPNERCTQRE